jgi:molecular chaperone DnaK
MLLTNDKFARSILNERATERLSQFRQRSVNARGLGILIRDAHSTHRVPHYLIPANSQLPAAKTQRYGTVVPNQRRVNLQIVESGLSKDQPPVKLGECIINDLPPNLREGSEIDVTIRYDANARVHVDAVDVSSGKTASVEIIRQENLVAQLAADHVSEQSAELKQLSQSRGAAQTESKPRQQPPPSAKELPAPVSSMQRTEPRAKPAGPSIRPIPAPHAIGQTPASRKELEDSDEPVPLDENGQPLDITRLSQTYEVSTRKKSQPVRPSKQTRPMTRPGGSQIPAPPADDEILELDQQNAKRRPPAGRKRTPTTRPSSQRQSSPPPEAQDGDEFWGLTE